MKFIVDSLPHYGDYCPFDNILSPIVCGASGTEHCPRYWSKETVCSDDDNHKECELLREMEYYLKDKEH